MRFMLMILAMKMWFTIKTTTIMRPNIYKLVHFFLNKETKDPIKILQYSIRFVITFLMSMFIEFLIDHWLKFIACAIPKNGNFSFLFQRYGVENGVFAGVFDGHGKNGEIVSKLVMNKLPSLFLKNILSLPKISPVDNEAVKTNDFNKWKEACFSSFKLMDKDIKSLQKLDCSCSGTTAVVAIRQVMRNFFRDHSEFRNKSFI